MNECEFLMWKHLEPLGFKPQVPFGTYYADFFSHQLWICVEVDGKSHHSAKAKEYDQKRDAFFAKYGVKTIRVSAKSVYSCPWDAFCKVLDGIGDAVTAETKADWLHKSGLTPSWSRHDKAAVKEATKRERLKESRHSKRRRQKKKRKRKARINQLGLIERGRF